jgi:NADPH:quinone reductase-like Zn-dependent oxidoreductase
MVYSSFGDLLRSLTSRRLVAGPAREDPKHLPLLKQLAESGAYRPVIDRVYPFDDIVEAHRRVDSGHKRGSVVLKLVA